MINMASETSRYRVLAFLVAIAFIFGGGSRGDITSLIIFRPLTFLVLGFSLWHMSSASFRRAGAPLWLVVALFGLAAIQLVPLPPEVWTSLPGRRLALTVLETAGLEDTWRPISLSPSRTLNALLSLGAPMAALCLCIARPRLCRARLVWLILLAGLATSLMSLLQLMGPTDGPLYFYRITSSGVSVGLFSNRNHNAIFLASVIPLVAWVGMQTRTDRGQSNRHLRTVGTFGSILFLFAVILVTGSRNGTALGIALVLAVAGLIFLAQRVRPSAAGKPNLVMRMAPVAFVLAVAGIALATYAASRSLAFDRFAGQNLDAGLRGALLPHLRDLVVKYFPVGSGLGSFYLVFQIIEPTAMLRPEYINQAHNDPAQLAIEGGLFGIVLLAAGLIWFVITGWRCIRNYLAMARRGFDPDPALFAWLALSALLAGSVFDYPLRTPSLMVTAALLATIAQFWLQDRDGEANA